MPNDNEPSSASAKSIYRNSRDMVQSVGVNESKRGDLTGAKRGVFHAGLACCAIGASSVAEALPFARQLIKETGEPGWLLAREALAADSAPFLESLIELGLLDPNERVWTGYLTQAGAPVLERSSALEAIHLGAPRCLEALLKTEPLEGLLAAATRSGNPKCFEMLLERAIASPEELNLALAQLCREASSKRNHEDLSCGEMVQKLLGAGARMSFAPVGMEPPRSWNGAKVESLDSVWTPALILAEPSELPKGASGAGRMDTAAFFGLWSSACYLVRSAIESGSHEPAARALLTTPGWESFSAPGSPLSPFAMLALADANLTDSGLRRMPLNSVEIILSSRLLDAELARPGAFNVVRIALSHWLWGAKDPRAGGLAPAPGMALPQLIRELSKRCVLLGLTPLGERGSAAAAQRFVERLAYFGPFSLNSPLPTMRESSTGAKERYEARELRDAEALAKEMEAASALGAMMAPGAARELESAMERYKARGHIQSDSQRVAFKEELSLGLGLAPGSASVARRACI